MGVVLITIIGISLPNPRISATAFQVSAPIDAVWDRVTDHKNQVKWRKGLKEVSINADDPNQWTEIPIEGPSITFRTTKSIKHSIYRINIIPISGFQGYSTIEFHEEGTNTQLIFFEVADITNPFRRILAYLFYNPKSSMKTYQKELQISLES